jgi:hypothetical protein
MHDTDIFSSRTFWTVIPSLHHTRPRSLPSPRWIRSAARASLTDCLRVYVNAILSVSVRGVAQLGINIVRTWTAQADRATTLFSDGADAEWALAMPQSASVVRTASPTSEACATDRVCPVARTCPSTTLCVGLNVEKQRSHSASG